MRTIKPSNYYLARVSGLDTTVLSSHHNLHDANKAMRAAGGEPGSLFTNGLLVLAGHKWQLLHVGKSWTVRPL